MDGGVAEGGEGLACVDAVGAVRAHPRRGAVRDLRAAGRVSWLSDFRWSGRGVGKERNGNGGGERGWTHHFTMLGLAKQALSQYWRRRLGMHEVK